MSEINEIILTEETKLETLFEETFDKSVKIIFKTETEEKSLELLDKIFAKEIEMVEDNKFDFTISVIIKSLPFEIREAMIKRAIETEDLVDSNFILNIYNLIKGYNTFDDSYFESEMIFINSIEEFLDIKIDLQEELLALQGKLIRFYISLFRSYSIVDIPDVDLYTKIPYQIQRLLYISDFMTLSNIMKDATAINDLVVVENAQYYINNLCKKSIIADTLINSLFTSMNNQQEKVEVSNEEEVK